MSSMKPQVAVAAYSYKEADHVLLDICNDLIDRKILVDRLLKMQKIIITPYADIHVVVVNYPEKLRDRHDRFDECFGFREYHRAMLRKPSDTEPYSGDDVIEYVLYLRNLERSEKEK